MIQLSIWGLSKTEHVSKATGGVLLKGEESTMR